MGLLRRLHPFDLALAALGIALAAWLLVTVPGYRWTRTTGGAFLRVVPVEVTVELASRFGGELRPGPFAAESNLGPRPIEILAVELLGAAPGEPTWRVRLRLEASVDGSGRAFWLDQRLRRGSGLSFADARTAYGGQIVAVDGLEAAAR